MTSNYFKVRGDAVRLFWFNDTDRVSARRAFGKASATPGVLSVFARPAVSGEWDAVPAIVSQVPVASSLALALDGEGGTY